MYIAMMKLQSITDEKVEVNLSNPYYMFKFSIRSEVTRKYYERRIKRFFDFIEFSTYEDIEVRCNDFAEKVHKDTNWGLNKIIFFLQFQKERTEKGEITAATLSNFVKALKLFYEISDIKINDNPFLSNLFLTSCVILSFSNIIIILV
jgi:hypothetical protein